MFLTLKRKLVKWKIGRKIWFTEMDDDGQQNMICRWVLTRARDRKKTSFLLVRGLENSNCEKKNVRFAFLLQRYASNRGIFVRSPSFG